MVKPIMQNLVLDVLFAEGLTHAMYKGTARFRPYVYQLGKLVKIQVHHQFSLILVDKLAIHHFIHELPLPKIVITIIVSSRLLTLIVHANMLVFQGVWKIKMLILDKL